ncbi:MAG: WD40/YVTN/BNR-like repeat-containing protein [Chloroflexota bacterium]
MKIKALVLLLVCAIFAFPLHVVARKSSKELLLAPLHVVGSTLEDNIYIKDVFTATGLPEVLVLWLGDKDSPAKLYPPRYTLNGGNTWQVAESYNLSYPFVGIMPRLDPQNPVRLFSLYEDLGSHLHSLHRSGDWGATWSPAVGNDDIEVMDVFVSPKDPQLMYVPWHRKCPSYPNPCEPPGGVYQSTDGGANWTSFIDEKQWSIFPVIMPSPVTAGDGYYQVVYTTGSGSYWLRFGSSERLPFPAWEIALDAVNAERIYGVNYNFDAGYTSSDGGHTWDTWEVPPGECSQLIAHPTQPNTLYLRCDGGIYRSVNGGEQWSSITSIPGDALKPNLGKPGQLLWSHSGCLWASDDQGTTWSGVSCIFVTASNVFLPLVR